MRNYILLMSLVVSMIFGSTSCRKGDITELEAGLGKVKLGVSSSGSFEVVGLGKSVDNVDVNSFAVKIYNSSNELVKSWEKCSDVPTVFGLEAGNYVVEAYSCEPVAAAWSQPHYYGRTEFTVIFDKVNSVELVCSLENMKVTLEYSNEFLANLPDFKVRVELLDQGGIPEGQDCHLEYTKDETRAGYFKAVPVVMLVSGTKLDGSDFSHSEQITEVSPRDWHHIKLTVNPIGQGALNIVVNTETTNVDHNYEIPTDDEDLGLGGDPTEPEPEDPGGPEEPGEPDPETPPVVQGDGFDIDQVVTITDGDIVGGVSTVPVKVAVTAEEGGIQKLSVQIAMSTEDLQALVEMMFGGDSFDLANVSGKPREAVESLGLLQAGQEIKGLTEFSFDVTAFMPLLAPGVSNFSIVVEDEKGNTTTKVLSVNRVN